MVTIKEAEEARRAGSHATQFNTAVSASESAAALWKRLGFSIVGALPRAYRQRESGPVDAYAMRRSPRAANPSRVTPARRLSPVVGVRLVDPALLRGMPKLSVKTAIL